MPDIRVGALLRTLSELGAAQQAMADEATETAAQHMAHLAAAQITEAPADAANQARPAPVIDTVDKSVDNGRK